MSKPLILLTNDDGFTAKGLLSLANSVNDLGELFIVAPTHPQSGMGHAITVNEPIRFEKTNYFKSINAYNCSGTPVDCIKAGMYLLGDRKPDLILSGINHGSNVSTNVLYSGTMSAAVEGALEGIPSIGFSLTDYSKDADFSTSNVIVQSIVKEALKNKIEKGICLNVNIPNVPFEKILRKSYDTIKSIFLSDNLLDDRIFLSLDDVTPICTWFLFLNMKIFNAFTFM